jgi:tetratricopeptide (TPR) repeat protein
MKPTAPQKRIHAAFRYNDAFQLKVSPMLWLAMFFGLRHVAIFLLISLRPNVPVFDFWYELQNDNILKISDLLVALVVVAANHRLPTSQAFWRKLWHQGRNVLLFAFCLDLVLFLVLHGTVLLEPDVYRFPPAVAVVLLDFSILAFLLRSTLVREIFADFPQSIEKNETLTRPSPSEILLAQEPLGPAAPLSGLALYLEGVAASNADQLGDAVILMRKAIDLEPENSLYQRHVCELCLRLNRFGEAIFFGRESTRLAPNNAEAHFNLALALNGAKRGDEAVESYRRTLLVNAKHVGALNNLGVLLAERGDNLGASQAFEQALAIQPEHPDAKNNLNSILLATTKRTQKPQLQA